MIGRWDTTSGAPSGYEVRTAQPAERGTAMNNLTIKQAKEIIYFCHSYNRLEEILNLYGRMRLSSWFRVLGENWTFCDNNFQFCAPLYEVLRGYGTIHEMMRRNERRHFDQLPEVMTIYRGCGVQQRRLIVVTRQTSGGEVPVHDAVFIS